MAMLNVSALITGYDTVGDHTEFVVEVCLCVCLLPFFSSPLTILDPRRSRVIAACGVFHGALATLISFIRV